MFDFRRGERLRECVGDHVVGRAIDETNRAVLDDPTDEMEAHVDVLRVRVILVVLGERNRGLVVQKEGRCVEGGVEDFGDEGTKPECFLRSVCRGDVFGLRGRERDDVLAFSAPGNGAAIKNKGVP